TRRSAPGGASAVAQSVHPRKPRCSSRRRACITGSPPISMRGWQTIPTASGMRLQVQQEFAVALRPEYGRGDLAGHLVADLGRKTAKLVENLVVLRRIPDHPTLSYRSLADLELRLDQRHDVARRPEQLANPAQPQTPRHEGDVDHREVSRLRSLLEMA